MLTVATVNKWSIRQLDVKNAFLHYTVFLKNQSMEQPSGFLHSTFPSHVCGLKKALYGLKQGPRAWFDRLSKFLLNMGFFCTTADPSLFVSHSGQGTLLLLLYVDDMVVTGNNPILLDFLITQLG